MTTLSSFLRTLFAEGTVVFTGKPALPPSDPVAATEILAEVFAAERLEVAGPPLKFVRDTALAASLFVQQACWFLVQRGEAVDELERCLRMPPPRTPDDHLSADLALRYLPVLQRRAVALGPDDPLVERLDSVLCAWPLSGVLADVGAAPTTPLDFGGHPGLQLLYAERWAGNEKHAWLPTQSAFDYLPLVYHLLGKSPPAAVSQRLESEADVGSPE